MQKWKNILGSRKKGAQEPHAAREPRYDYQGNTTSNLKGISLECLPLPVGITSYSLCLLFYRSYIAHYCPVKLNICMSSFCFCFFFVCFFFYLRLPSESSLLAQDESRSLGDVAIDMDSQGSSMQLQLIDEQVCRRGRFGNWAGIFLFFTMFSFGLTGCLHSEPGRYHAEHWEHHRGAGLYIPAASTHGQGAGGDHSEVRQKTLNTQICSI